VQAYCLGRAAGSGCRAGSSEQCTGRVAHEHLAVANIARKHRVAGMAGLTPNLKRGDTVPRGAGRQSRPEAAIQEVAIHFT
jgi:hypothetical protein